MAMRNRWVLMGSGVMMMAAGCANQGNDGARGPEGRAVVAVADSPEGLRACLAAAARRGDGAAMLGYLEQGTTWRAAAGKVTAAMVEAAGAKLALQEAVRGRFGSDALHELNPLFVFPNLDDGLGRMARDFERAQVKRDEGHTYLVIKDSPVEIVERGGRWKMIPLGPREASVGELERLAAMNAALRDALREARGLVDKALTVEKLNEAIQGLVDKHMEERLKVKG